jgi:hypothetical protein
MIRIISRSVAICALVMLVGCGGVSPKVQIDRADRGAFQALRAFQLSETAAFRVSAPWPTADQHKQIGAKLSEAYTLVIDVANIGIALQPGQPLSAAAVSELDQLSKTVADVVALVSPNAGPDVKSKADDASSAVKSLINIVKGAQ